MQVSTDYEQGWSFQYERAEEVPRVCCAAAQLLDSQPLFEGQNLLVKPHKVLPLDSWDDARIIDIFNSNARTLSEPKAIWHISDVRNHQLGDAHCQRIKQGLALYFYDNSEQFSLKALEKSCVEVYNSMRKGWVESNPEEHPYIMFKQDPKQFALFIKKDKIIEEDTLIRFLTHKFELGGQIKCDAEWKKEGVGGGRIYMWIDKQKMPKIIEIFGFEIGSSQKRVPLEWRDTPNT